ncbi:MAG TPA: hypothetical protein P5042_06155, partial [Candidatus Izemoplasmatales bacterium]|nr:hypothetical protein [Candidatus Izemoplasmatales bacterium]
MAIAKLKLINITSDLTNLDPVLAKFVSLHCLNPVLSSQFVERVHGLKPISEENPTEVTLTELSAIEKEFDIKIPADGTEINEYSPENMKTYISTTHQKLKDFVEKKKELQDQLEKHENALVQIRNIESMDISLDDLFSCRYIYARVGRLPKASIEKLDYYRTRPFIFNSFETEGEYSWCMYFTSPEYEREVDNIFSSLFFERIYIPDFVHGTPENAEAQLVKDVETIKKKTAKLQNEINGFLKKSEHELTDIKNELLFLAK